MSVEWRSDYWQSVTTENVYYICKNLLLTKYFGRNGQSSGIIHNIQMQFLILYVDIVNCMTKAHFGRNILWAKVLVCIINIPSFYQGVLSILVLLSSSSPPPSSSSLSQRCSNKAVGSHNVLTFYIKVHLYFPLFLTNLGEVPERDFHTLLLSCGLRENPYIGSDSYSWVQSRHIACVLYIVL